MRAIAQYGDDYLLVATGTPDMYVCDMSGRTFRRMSQMPGINILSFCYEMCIRDRLQPDQPVAVRPEPHAAVRRIAVNRIHRTEIGARDGFDGRDAPRGTRKHIEPGAVVPDEQVVAESPGEGVDGIITQSPGYVADRCLLYTS